MAAGLFSSIASGMGGAGPKYRGYKPSKGRLGRYEAGIEKDIQGLEGERPYQDPSLGYAPEVEAKAKGLSQGDVTAERQNLADAYSRGGRYGLGSREYLSAEAGRGRSAREYGQRTGAGIAVRSADVARSDWARRHGARSGAYETGANLYNATASGEYRANVARHAQKKQRYQVAGSVLDMASIGAI